MQVWIGTSGYSYPDWVGPVYPPGTSQPKMLSHYSTLFPLVELNFTYYRLPTPEMLARQAEKTPEGFQFLVKFPGTISHEEKPTDISAFRQAVEVLRAKKRLLGLLLQLPQAAHQTNRRWQWLEYLFQEFASFDLALEFRHRSWAEPAVLERLTRNQVCLVSVDVPDLPDLFPRGLVQTVPTLYLRLHSRKAENWYASDRDRYDYNFSDSEMREWIDRLTATERQIQKAFVLFNNCHHAQAAANARRFKQLLQTLSNSPEIVEPFGTIPREKTLFD